MFYRIADFPIVQQVAAVFRDNGSSSRGGRHRWLACAPASGENAARIATRLADACNKDFVVSRAASP